MKNRIIIFSTVLVVMICITGFMIVNAEKKVELVEEAQSLVEPYEIYNEWKYEIFSKYGFSSVSVPAEVYHIKSEKGQTYVVGTFYTERFEKFEYFFKQVYQILWGELYDIEKVLELKDGVYSYSEKCAVPETDNSDTSYSDYDLDIEDATEEDGGEEVNESDETNDKIEFVNIYIEYDSNENKVTFRLEDVKE